MKQFTFIFVISLAVLLADASILGRRLNQENLSKVATQTSSPAADSQRALDLPVIGSLANIASLIGNVISKGLSAGVSGNFGGNIGGNVGINWWGMGGININGNVTGNAGANGTAGIPGVGGLRGAGGPGGLPGVGDIPVIGGLLGGLPVIG